MRRTKYLFILFAFFIASCGGGNTMDEKTFVGVYAHIFVIRTSTADSNAAATQVQTILDAHHTTKEQMREQLNAYSEDPETYRRVLQEIDDTLKTLNR